MTTFALTRKAKADLRSIALYTEERCSHVIFYRIAPDSLLEIVRVLHKSMDAETKLIGG